MKILLKTTDLIALKQLPTLNKMAFSEAIWKKQSQTYIPNMSPLDQIPQPEDLDTFKVSDLTIELTKNYKKIPVFTPTLAFGSVSSDHLLDINWSQTKGWGKPQIIPYQEYKIDPFNSSLHYAIQCFEGMKAFKDAKGTIRLFRPQLNMNRFRRSCIRISLPDFNGNELLECLKQFLKVEQAWIPSLYGYSFYIRPTGISMTDLLGVRAPTKSKIFVCGSPVGPYYPSGFKPVGLYCEMRHIRTAPKGFGQFKLGSNYGPTITVSKAAELKGYAQILWLYEDYITEVGTSNLFFYWKNEQGEDELVTHPGDDLILHGVTRNSVLAICREWNRFKVTERPIKIQEIIKAIKEGRLHEAFSSGTAVTIGPINQICYDFQEYKIPIIKEYNAGKLSKQISDAIMDIQYGKVEHPWSVVVN